MSASTPGTDVVPAMTNRERGEMGSLARKQAKLLKDDLDSIAAERVAQAEAQLAAIYVSTDELWKASTDLAKAAVDEANRVIAEQWKAAGQPPSFTPSARFGWSGRGENADRERRSELRAAIRTRIIADTKAAKASVERRSVQIQTELVRVGLTTDAARQFLESMPAAAELLPAVDVDRLQGELTARKEAQYERTLDDVARWSR